MNEKGFMYPVTLLFLILISVFLTIQYDQYLSEKKLLKEVEQNEKKQFYFLQSIKKVEELLQNGTCGNTGEFDYKGGVVFYSVKEMNGDLLEITFRLETPSKSQTIGFGYFDKVMEQMIKWVEKG